VESVCDAYAKTRSRRSTHSQKPGTESVGRDDVTRSLLDARKSRRSESTAENDGFPLDDIFKQRVKATGIRGERDSKKCEILRVLQPELNQLMQQTRLGDEDSIDQSRGTARARTTENTRSFTHSGGDCRGKRRQHHAAPEGVQQVVVGPNEEAAIVELENTKKRTAS